MLGHFSFSAAFTYSPFSVQSNRAASTGGALKPPSSWRIDGKPLDLNIRVTDVLRKTNGRWLIIHEHASFPVDMAIGKADFLSKP